MGVISIICHFRTVMRHECFDYLHDLVTVQDLVSFVKGVDPAITYKNLGLPPGWYKALEWVFPTWARTHALDPGEAVNVLKAAIVTADRIVTVSQVLLCYKLYHMDYFGMCKELVGYVFLTLYHVLIFHVFLFFW